MRVECTIRKKICLHDYLRQIYALRAGVWVGVLRLSACLSKGHTRCSRARALVELLLAAVTFTAAVALLFGIEKDRSKFARWGDNYQYHIGDLSAAALAGHPVDKISPKYSRWAADLFDEIPSENPRLKEDVRFWVKAWKTTDIGIWSEMSPTRLTFLEYLLIGVASSIFGDRLLNAEGRNR